MVVAALRDKSLRDAEKRRLAQSGEGEREECVLSAVDEVARHEERDSQTDCRAVYGRDQRLPHIVSHRDEVPCVINTGADFVAGNDFLEIRTGREDGRETMNQNDPDIRIFIGILKGR